jgi:hypothetical protein
MPTPIVGKKYRLKRTLPIHNINDIAQVMTLNYPNIVVMVFENDIDVYYKWQTHGLCFPRDTFFDWFDEVPEVPDEKPRVTCSKEFADCLKCFLSVFEKSECPIRDQIISFINYNTAEEEIR